MKTSKEGSVLKPLADPRLVAPEDIRRIFVFAHHKKILADPKLGESVVDTWPLVAALRRQYPDATIYLATHFPGPYFADYFQGKIVPVPVHPTAMLKASRCSGKWDRYSDEEWRGYALGDMADLISGADRRIAFLSGVHAWRANGSRHGSG